MIRRQVVLAISTMLAILATSASAQEVTVTGQVERPVWWANVPAQLRDNFMLTNPDTIADVFQNL